MDHQKDKADDSFNLLRPGDTSEIFILEKKVPLVDLLDDELEDKKIFAKCGTGKIQDNNNVLKEIAEEVLTKQAVNSNNISISASVKHDQHFSHARSHNSPKKFKENKVFDTKSGVKSESRPKYRRDSPSKSAATTSTHPFSQNGNGHRGFDRHWNRHSENRYNRRNSPRRDRYDNRRPNSNQHSYKYRPYDRDRNFNSYHYRDRNTNRSRNHHSNSPSREHYKGRSYYNRNYSSYNGEYNNRAYNGNNNRYNSRHDNNSYNGNRTNNSSDRENRSLVNYNREAFSNYPWSVWTNNDIQSYTYRQTSYSHNSPYHYERVELVNINIYTQRNDSNDRDNEYPIDFNSNCRSESHYNHNSIA